MDLFLLLYKLIAKGMLPKSLNYTSWPIFGNPASCVMSVKLKYICSAHWKHPDQACLWMTAEKKNWTHPLQSLTWTSRCLTLLPYSFFFSLPQRSACRILVSQPGMKPMPPTEEAQSPNRWTTRELPLSTLNIKEAWLRTQGRWFSGTLAHHLSLLAFWIKSLFLVPIVCLSAYWPAVWWAVPAWTQ